MDIIRDLRSDMSLGIVIDKSILTRVPGDDSGVKWSLLNGILFNLFFDCLSVMQNWGGPSVNLRKQKLRLFLV